MPILHKLPQEDQNLKNQTAPSDISDEDFRKAYADPKYTKCQVFGQILLFIFILGWLRLFLFLVGTVVYIVLMAPIHAFSHHAKFIKYVGEPYGNFVSRRYIRFLLYMFGIYYIKKEGKVDYNARGIFYNHTSIVDGPIIWLFRYFTIIGTISIKYVPIFGQICTASGAAFIDRSKSQGNASIIKHVMEDHDAKPACVAPEGKIMDGSVILGFRTGSFLTDEPYQPVCIRYNDYFAFCKTTHSFVMDSFFEWLFLAFSVPFCTLHVTFLDTVTSEMQEGKDPAQKAEQCQLLMANYLGVRAINRTSKEIFGQSKKANSENTTALPLLEDNPPEKFSEAANGI